MHEYNAETASGRFFRIRVDGGKWEELPSGPRVQGLALVAHGDSVIRIGGMQPRNRPGEDADSRSLKSVARYDPAAKKWLPMPDMPSGRSSHEAAVVGGKLYVVGGWEMLGKGTSPRWHSTMLVIDLEARVPKWSEVKQPFKRRALGSAAVGGKLYVVGGLGAEKATSEVNVYDPKAGKWSSTPDLPGTSRHGFSPAACEAGGILYVSTSDGVLHRLKADGSGWQKAGTTSKRLVHRLVPGEKGRVILLGGNAAESRDVEEVTPKVE
jgi:N-acetylneuraminic acid mutarotase